MNYFSFQWYLDNVYPELFLPTKSVFQGSLRSAVSSLCLTVPKGRTKDLVRQQPYLYPCKVFNNIKWNIQTWYFSCRYL